MSVLKLREKDVKLRENIKIHEVNYFQGFVQTAKAKGSQFVQTAKRKFYTEKIPLSSVSKELCDVVIALSNRHPPKILPTINPIAELPCLSSDTLQTKQKNIELTLLHSLLLQHGLLEQLLHLFLNLKTCHNIQWKNAFLILLLCHVTMIPTFPNTE